MFKDKQSWAHFTIPKHTNDVNQLHETLNIHAADGGEGGGKQIFEKSAMLVWVQSYLKAIDYTEGICFCHAHSQDTFTSCHRHLQCPPGFREAP